MKYDLKTPCAHCPFRNDIRPFLRKARVREIEAGLNRGTFACHATLEYHDSGVRETAKTQHCAGALIVMEIERRPGQMMRIAERLGMYKPQELDRDAPVYLSFDEMAEAQDR